MRKRGGGWVCLLAAALSIAGAHPAAGQPNDDCSGAIGPLAIPSTTAGSTTAATPDDVPNCFAEPTAPGVWYTAIGTGTTITASLCGPATDFDTQLSVFDGSCMDLNCIVGGDEGCPPDSHATVVSWCAGPAQTYRVLVHGFRTATGNFALKLSEDGVACQPFRPKPAIEYQQETCDSPFEDIAMTGTPLMLGDDQGIVVPVGFSFTFFGDPHTSIGVSSNGYLSFGGTLDAYLSGPIPRPFEPNDLIAALWTDLDPGQGGSIEYTTVGTAPARRLIVQWTGVPLVGQSDANTFQAVLFEDSDAIELRYGAFTPETIVDQYTAGIENQTGTRGLSTSFALLSSGSCIRFAPRPVPPAPTVSGWGLGVITVLLLAVAARRMRRWA